MTKKEEIKGSLQNLSDSIEACGYSVMGRGQIYYL